MVKEMQYPGLFQDTPYNIRDVPRTNLQSQNYVFVGLLQLIRFRIFMHIQMALGT